MKALTPSSLHVFRVASWYWSHVQHDINWPSVSCVELGCVHGSNGCEKKFESTESLSLTWVPVPELHVLGLWDVLFRCPEHGRMLAFPLPVMLYLIVPLILSLILIWFFCITLNSLILLIFKHEWIIWFTNISFPSASLTSWIASCMSGTCWEVFSLWGVLLSSYSIFR